MQMALVLCIAAAGLGVSTQSSSAATLRATIDLSRQRMTVHVNGVRKYRWVVSTGKDGWLTKPGVYQPFAQREKFYSQKWKMSLPYLTFIGQDGTAIHGTYLTKKLGRRASHGCIRLSISNAQKFYKLVQEHGFWGTEVVVKR
ncbi:MAG: L,D-transpeptidase [Hyphomicrobiaceae bacterium]|nr:L,D-transpeptidase [Hyphomicrobiaceae bacterium]